MAFSVGRVEVSSTEVGWMASKPAPSTIMTSSVVDNETSWEGELTLALTWGIDDESDGGPLDVDILVPWLVTFEDEGGNEDFELTLVIVAAFPESGVAVANLCVDFAAERGK